MATVHGEVAAEGIAVVRVEGADGEAVVQFVAPDVEFALAEKSRLQVLRQIVGWLLML